MKLNKKKVMITTCSVILLITVIGLIHYVSNYKQYQKYCEGTCSNKLVSNQVLEQIIQARSEKETKQIQKDKNEIDRAIVKLDNASLNEKEQAEYQSFTIDPEYDSNSEYDVDQLIELAKTYDTALDNYNQLIESSDSRELKEKIEQKQKSIDSLLASINSLDLTTEEQSDYEQSLDYYNQIDYDQTKDYNSSELNVYLSEYGLSEINFENDLQTYQMVR